MAQTSPVMRVISTFPRLQAAEQTSAPGQSPHHICQWAQRSGGSGVVGEQDPNQDICTPRSYYTPMMGVWVPFKCRAGSARRMLRTCGGDQM